MSSSNYNAVSSQAASESTPAIPLMMSSLGTTFAPITTVGSIGMIPIMLTPTPTPTTTMFPGSITTLGGAFTPYPLAWAQFAADPANAQALQGYQQVMAMMQQAGGFMPFAYPGMTPPIMPPPVSTPSTFVPRMVPIHPVNLTRTLNEAAPSNFHEINEAEQEAARRKKGKAIAEPSKTRDSAFKRLGGKEDGPRKSAKLHLGLEMGRTSAMERLGGGRHAQSRRSRESETIHQDEEEAESQPRASAYTRLSYDEDDLDKIGSWADRVIKPERVQPEPTKDLEDACEKLLKGDPVTGKPYAYGGWVFRLANPDGGASATHDAEDNRADSPDGHAEAGSPHPDMNFNRMTTIIEDDDDDVQVLHSNRSPLSNSPGMDGATSARCSPIHEQS
ncbi:unnamed protein product [Cuscuta campestris]|uniref:Uncharacterized protein n=1 Tax=Cuscuta campestris TaxID=132261 RepID=A0A484K169_9ASTE|nr:unnamed protein product [Cuscuta campestris]